MWGDGTHANTLILTGELALVDGGAEDERAGEQRALVRVVERRGDCGGGAGREDAKREMRTGEHSLLDPSGDAEKLMASG